MADRSLQASYNRRLTLRLRLRLLECIKRVSRLPRRTRLIGQLNPGRANAWPGQLRGLGKRCQLSTASDSGSDSGAGSGAGNCATGFRIGI